ncbi:N-acetylmuramoyl-L-alanine amidase [Bacillus thuringiensis]|uniref:Autolysin n=1 Tax=Bacillus thuringiensis TaxID=1428 RepID=A0A9W3SJT9_BACTU|nr:N-acetylmuramoyl-L-alanine amidase [Bacillus thuringiensis]ANS52509.1 bifunctional autolysin [Bacillus thuringiensis]MBH0340056.1 N-acetylmuramoyl-L-alanine amidase [Bacillus thuringiensis]MBH0340551.1 N-acetylmuramoyl-L-alanine amidase [Bacillus thuringiensis]
MKRLLGIIATLCMLFSLSTSVFADRILLIPSVPKTPYRGGVGAYEGVVAHSTATPEAPAINIQRYETRTWRNAFVHYAVDWNETIQIADTKYIAYGAGPAANKRFVHVELCETADYAKFKGSYEKYVGLIASILKKNNLSVEKGLWTHNDVRKYLGGTDHEDPIDYLRSHGVSESQFRSDVQRAYNKGEMVEKAGKSSSVVHTQGIAYILGNNVNLRKGPGTHYGVIRQLNKPEAYQVWGEKDGWLNLGGDQWVKYNPAYIRFEKQESVNPVVGKRVVSKVNNLRFYDSSSWQDEDVAGTVNAGEGFTIDEKVSVDGFTQLKVHNSKGRTYYMTSSEAFVYVK